MKACWALLALVLAAPSSLATPVSSALTGRVTSGNQPVADVTVTATSGALMQPRTTTTGPAGTYWLGALPPGVYDVTFSHAGLTTLTRRAIVTLARVARADAVLEPNEDEDSVTSTAVSIGVGDTTSITTHFTDGLLDRLPIRRDPEAAARVAPGALVAAPVELDGLPFPATALVGEEITDEVTVIRSEPNRIAAVTHSGGEALHVSLRDTLSNGEHQFESASGGRIVPERLWFFAAGWSGDAADGSAIKLSAQPSASTNVIGQWLDAGATRTSLRYTGAAGDHVTVEAIAGRTAFAGIDTHSAAMKTAYFVPTARGDHVVSAGGRVLDATDRSWSFFANDRFARDRWTIDAGLRREEDDDLAARFAATYDLFGDGRRALAATYGEFGDARLASIGYVSAIGASGGARIDALRREAAGLCTDALQIDGRYRLFDQFELAANYTYTGSDRAHLPEHVANVWMSAEFPIGERRLGATVLQHVVERATATDLAVRVAIPFPRFTLTLAGDLTNAFDAAPAPLIEPRTARVWARIRH